MFGIFLPAKALPSINNIQATIGDSNKSIVKITWDKVSSATGYRIIYDRTTSITPPDGVNEYNLSDVSNGPHTIEITALDVSGNPIASGTKSIIKSDTGIVDGGTTGGGTPSTINTKWGPLNLPLSNFTSSDSLAIGILEKLFLFAGILAVIAIIYSGIMYITAGGDTAKADTAKKNLTWAIIGVVIILLAIVIVSLISTIFN